MASSSLPPLDPAPIYLNNAATTHPKPPLVLDAVAATLSAAPESPHRGGREPSQRPATPDELARIDYTIESVRGTVARFFGAEDPLCVSFSSGATASLNLAIESVCRGGGHIVTTTAEHNSVLRPLYRAAREYGVDLSFADCDVDGSVPTGNVLNLFRSDTRAVVMTHGSNVTGAVNDVATIAEVAHERGAILIVDAAQTAGHLPIDFDADGLDALVFAGHKALYGMPGVGGMITRPGLVFRPQAVGGTGSRSDLEHQPEEQPVRYEAGTPNTPGIASLAAGIRFIEDTAHESATELDGVETAADGLRRVPGVRVYAETHGPKTPTLSFTVDGFTPDEVALILSSSYGISVRAGLHCAPLIHRSLSTFPNGTVRASFSRLTPEDAADRLVAAVSRIAAAGGEARK